MRIYQRAPKADDGSCECCLVAQVSARLCRRCTRAGCNPKTYRDEHDKIIRARCKVRRWR